MSVNNEYKSVLELVSAEDLINKSKFIANTKHVTSEDEAIAFINEMKEKYKDATHNVSAYIINGSIPTKRYDEDGEPQGSSARPILGVMDVEGLSNIVCVVTRYFGGIKLGVGGLVRAYSGAFKKSIEGHIYDYGSFLKYRLTFPYAEFDKIKNHLSHTVYDLDNLEYMENISADIYIKEEDSEELLETLKNLANRELDYEFGDEYIKAHIDKRIVK
ncbi:YigZ family protein [uncultured Fenollaria sp.]|uniref:IMPACT family protein n=1 Tax=uncultured Fenollaria sp. TaxID=1686315 RepID=UPI0025FC7BF1|nr:YigZ family protein [uncultured Fenollaria sp.]